ncbi:MAG: DUF3857 domain-containing protein [bacterium]
MRQTKFIILTLLLFPASSSICALESAEVLLSERNVVIGNDMMETITHRMIKVNTGEGMERYEELDITYNKDYNEVKVLEIYRCIPDGQGGYAKENVLSDSRIHHSLQGENIESSFYMDTVTIRMPVENPGDVFEYSILIKQKKPMIKDHFWNVLVFDDVVPVKKSIFNITIPRDRELYYKTYNLNIKPVVQEDDKMRIHHWETENLPALKVNPGEVMIQDMLAKVVVSSTNGWDDIIEWFDEIYQDKMEATERIKKKTKELIKANVKTGSELPPEVRKLYSIEIGNKGSNTSEVIRSIYEYVAYTLRYLGNELGKGAFIPRPAEEILKAMQGDCKGKIVLLTAMLRSAELEAYPALVNIGSLIPLEEQMPMPFYFNHAIVYVPKQKDLNKDYWLDPTLYNARWDFVPPEEIGRDALVLKGNGKSGFLKIE